MINKALLLAAFCGFTFTVKAQGNKCDSICKQPIDMAKPQSVVKNILLFKACGLDDVDIKFFSNGSILGSLLIQAASENVKVKTYGDLLNLILHTKQSSSYANMLANYQEKTPQNQKTPNPPLSSINTVNDYDKALKQAMLQKKPLLVFFTAKRGVNAIKFTTDILSNKQVLAQLTRFVVAKLEVDDPTPLNPRFKSNHGTIVSTVGEKNAYIQTNIFGSNYQPLVYVVTASGYDKKEMYNGNYYNLADFLTFLERVK